MISPDRAGLQPERTALAWQRTSVTATLAVIPLILVDAKLGQWWLVVLASVGALSAAILLTGLPQRLHQLLDDRQSTTPLWAIVRVAAAAGVCSLIGTATGLLVWRS